MTNTPLSSQADPNDDPAGDLTFGSPLAEALGEWNRVFGLDHRPWPTVDVPAAIVRLRSSLIREEHKEVQEELDLVLAGAGDPGRLLKELADLQITIQGTADAFGLDLDAGVREVHRSNMSKVGPDGRTVRRADGKILKPAGYVPPDMSVALGQRATQVTG